MTGAATQIDRIISIVSLLSRRDREGQPAAKVNELAKTFGVTEAQIRRDLVTLTMVCGEADSEWLLSLSVLLGADTVEASTRGPFQRPVRLTTEELTALQVGLAIEVDSPPALVAELSSVSMEEQEPERFFVIGTGVFGEKRVTDLARSAIREERCLDLTYAGEGASASTVRTVEPHQVIFHAGKAYIKAYCRTAHDWRRFRADRVIDAVPTDKAFAWRDDFVAVTDAAGVFVEPEVVDEVRVRFSAEIARWITEQYPDVSENADGSVVVSFRVADADWFVRHILQYADQAEVLGDESYREAVQQAAMEATMGSILI